MVNVTIDLGSYNKEFYGNTAAGATEVIDTGIAYVPEITDSNGRIDIYVYSDYPDILIGTTTVVNNQYRVQWRNYGGTSCDFAARVRANHSIPR